MVLVKEMIQVMLKLNVKMVELQEALQLEPVCRPSRKALQSSFMQLLKSQMRLKDMLMEKFQKKLMKLGWKRKNLQDRDGAGMCNRARMKFQTLMNGQISIMDLLHLVKFYTKETKIKVERNCKIYTQYAYAEIYSKSSCRSP
jgi:hypothetical protein